MSRLRLQALIIFSVLSVACEGPPPKMISGDAPQSVGSLKYSAPDGWKAEQPTSSMRVAQFLLPRAEGDAEDASLVLYYFQGGGGSVQANLDRWVSQMQQPDGSPSKEKSKTSTMKVAGMTVTVMDVSGTYTAEMTPGAAERHNKSGYRMRAAVIETPRGPYFVKLTGPEKTIARWDQSFDAFINSFEFK
ncbi:MAG: hypothetical protein AB1631_22730 [Acidobacteriota bacterium]